MVPVIHPQKREAVLVQHMYVEKPPLSVSLHTYHQWPHRRTNPIPSNVQLLSVRPPAWVLVQLVPVTIHLVPMVIIAKDLLGKQAHLLKLPNDNVCDAAATLSYKIMTSQIMLPTEIKPESNVSGKS